MCAITGIFITDKGEGHVNREKLFAMRDWMISRGPDGEGAYIGFHDRVGLAHRRLSIIDTSSAGAQPMHTTDGRYSIVFNGEIYNFRELREELILRGIYFRSGSDTEVILALYAMYGESCLQWLEGMFALTIWDEQEKTMFLARDAFGIKPLYYAWDGAYFQFASQVRALLVSDSVDKSPEPAGHVGFMTWGSVPEPYTLFKGIRALEPGHSIQLRASGQFSIRRWNSIERELAIASGLRQNLSKSDRDGKIRAAMFDTVRKHLISDVPTGVFLSAGLDSTTITALATEVLGGPVETRTLAFQEFSRQPNDESPLAEMVARQNLTNHQTIFVEASDFRKELPRIIDSMDQPSIDAINTYFVSKAAADSGLTVALSGLGGDELFGGYSGFTDIPKHVNRLSTLSRVPGLGKGFRIVSSQFVRLGMKPKYAGLLEYGKSFASSYLLRRGLFMPWELPNVLDPELVREGWRDLNTLSCLEAIVQDNSNSRLAISALEITQYMRNMLLRDSDWASMAHSIELRVPLVDIALWRTVIQLISSNQPPTKLDMALTPKVRLPDEVLHRKKTGFEIPIQEWVSSYKPVDQSEPRFRTWAREVYSLYGESVKRNSVVVPTKRVC